MATVRYSCWWSKRHNKNDEMGSGAHMTADVSLLEQGREAGPLPLSLKYTTSVRSRPRWQGLEAVDFRWQTLSDDMKTAGPALSLGCRIWMTPKKPNEGGQDLLSYRGTTTQRKSLLEKDVSTAVSERLTTRPVAISYRSQGDSGGGSFGGSLRISADGLLAADA